MLPSAALTAGLIALYVANLIHNDIGLDPAVVPATVFAVSYPFWRKGGLLVAAAFFVALPSFAFLRFAALVDPSQLQPFANHWALLTAGVSAVMSVVLACLAKSVPPASEGS
jgi:hypothetical protein